MALIKNASAKQIARDAIVLDLGDLFRQGETIVAQAKARADELVRTGQAERDRLVAGAAEQGRTEGLARGTAEGLAKGHEQGRLEALEQSKERLEAISAGWAAALDSFIRERDRMLHEAVTDVVRLAAAVASKVTKRAIELNPAVVQDQLREVLTLIVRPSALSVAVHPEDRSLVEAALPSLMPRFSAVSHVELTDDPSLDRGSCVARMRGETAGTGAPPGGELDASIHTQLSRIVEALLPGESAGAAASASPRDPGPASEPAP